MSRFESWRRDAREAETDRPAYEDMPQWRGNLRGHSHRCWCGRWWHEEGDADCVLVDKMTCPMHEGERDPEQLELPL